MLLRAKAMQKDRSTKTIAHVIATNFLGGPEKQILAHLIHADPGRYRSVLLSFIENNGENEMLMEASRLNIPHFGVRMAGRIDLRALFALKRLIKQQGVDLICAHGYKSTVMCFCLRSAVKAGMLGFSRGYTSENRFVSFYERLDRYALNCLDGIVCVSEAQQNSLKSLGVNPKKCWVVHNAVAIRKPTGDVNANKKKIFSSLSIPPEDKLVVCAGRLSPEKGQADLLQAISKIGQRSEDCTFVFCGDGPCRNELESRAKSLGLCERVRFAGFRRDLQQIFEAMDLLVLPSHTEGLPNVVLEAFSCGKTAVATCVGGVPELVEHGQNGILVPPGKPESIADAVTQILGNPAMRQTLGSAAQRTVASRFSFEEQTRQLEAIYAEMLSP